ncbi:MAG: hypothetical protein K2X62_14220 [Beijerinckiaceae bacterium]|jgi:hypothetical protein|nr:hypothetical protein [Beijerinckiaceae bacterium]
MTRNDHLRDREQVLGEALRDFSAELRLVDPADLIAFVRMEQYANIEDLVSSSAELFFQPTTLTFGWGAEMSVTWTDMPCVFLDMEFRQGPVTVFFCLGLQAAGASVEIRCISFEEPSPDPLVNTARLVSALGEARSVSSRP